MSLQLRIDGTRFRDTEDREVTLHGINVAADAKFPRHPDLPSHEPRDFFDGDNVSFVGRPFEASEAAIHFERLRKFGYNTIRYIFTWEAIEAAGPGKYDEAFIKHTIAVLRTAKDFGFHVFMDPHQDVWSRFTGGDGAPMWTLYACGLDPKQFAITEAALVQNTAPVPADFPKMIWATNYTRMACQVMFTLFFAGKLFAPRAIIDGVNIQDWLQNHFIAACKYLALQISEAGGLEDCIMGWESVNEPNRGLIGNQNLTIIPSEQKLQLGTSPSAFQAILTGSGRACEIEEWSFGGLGPYKSGSTLVDPLGQTIWLKDGAYDSKYGWKRDPGWKLGVCIWAQHGVWDPATDRLNVPDYFARSGTAEKIDYEYFTNHFFMDYYRAYKTAIRTVFPQTLMLLQPPALELPPSLKNTADDDPNMIFAAHWYDGMTLMTKKWNRYWNIDVFGVLRGRYLTPAFAIKIGETAIRNCFRDSLAAIKKEGLDYMGIHPCIFTELGVPMDMNQSQAYRTGDYSSQSSALDANHFALEASQSAFTLWNYTATNVHQWGDQWDGEDLSIFSLDDQPLPRVPPSLSDSTVSPDRSSPSFSQSVTSGETSGSRQKAIATMSEMPAASHRLVEDLDDVAGGSFRAAEAYIRPTPIATHGDISSFGFDLRNCVFQLALDAPSPTKEHAPTEIFLPDYHFPSGHVEVEISGGKWEIALDQTCASPMQILKWWHAAGPQSITIKGVVTQSGSLNSTEEDKSYLQQCKEKGCVMM